MKANGEGKERQRKTYFSTTPGLIIERNVRERDEERYIGKYREKRVLTGGLIDTL